MSSIEVESSIISLFTISTIFVKTTIPTKISSVLCLIISNDSLVPVSVLSVDASSGVEELFSVSSHSSGIPVSVVDNSSVVGFQVSRSLTVIITPLSSSSLRFVLLSVTVSSSSGGSSDSSKLSSVSEFSEVSGSSESGLSLLVSESSEVSGSSSGGGASS